MAGKQQRWHTARQECAARIAELAQFFSGELALTQSTKDDALRDWFSLFLYTCVFIYVKCHINVCTCMHTEH